MNTTNYAIELMISGICTFLWLLLLSLAFWGDKMDSSFLEGDNKIIISILLLPIIYVIGIISDRMTDELFERFFPLREKRIGKEKHRRALSIVYANSDNLTKLYEYGRMRIRILRNWTVNAVLILISLLIFIWSSSIFENSSTKIQVSLLFFFALGLSVFASFYAWKKMNIKEFEFLKIQSELLSKVL